MKCYVSLHKLNGEKEQTEVLGRVGVVFISSRGTEVFFIFKVPVKEQRVMW